MVQDSKPGHLPRRFDDDHIIQSLSRFILLIGRTQVFGPDDLPDASAVQSGYTLAALHGNKPLKSNVPLFPFIDGQEISNPLPEAQVFFRYTNFIVNHLRIEDNESALFERFAKIKVGPSKTFIGQRLSQQMYRAIRNGISDGSKKIDEVLASVPDVIVRGWSYRYRPEVVRNDYLARAVYSRITVFPNVPKEETFHLTGWQDTDGNLLDSMRQLATP